MIKFGITLFVLTFLADYSFGKETDKVLVLGEEAYDFGLIKSASPKILEHTFSLTNCSDQTLKIKEVQSSCGCTVAELKEKGIASHSVFEIKVSLKLNPQRAGKNSSILVIYEDESSTLLKVSVVVPFSTRISPDPLDFEVTKGLTNELIFEVHKTFSLTNSKEIPKLVINPVEGLIFQIKEVAELPLKDVSKRGKLFRFVTIIRPNQDSCNFEREIEMVFSDGERLKRKLSLQEKLAFFFEPRRTFAGRRKTQESQTLYLKLKSELPVEKIYSENPQIKLEKADKGKVGELSLKAKVQWDKSIGVQEIQSFAVINETNRIPFSIVALIYDK